jgi:hypothetical protein
VHYALGGFENWQAWAAFWDRQTADPNADLVEVYTASRLAD